MLKKRADYDGAEALYRRAIAIVVKTFGEAQNYKQGIYENNLADCFRKRTKFDDALNLYKVRTGPARLPLTVPFAARTGHHPVEARRGTLGGGGGDAQPGPSAAPARPL